MLLAVVPAAQLLQGIRGRQVASGGARGGAPAQRALSARRMVLTSAMKRGSKAEDQVAEPEPEPVAEAPILAAAPTAAADAEDAGAGLPRLDAAAVAPAVTLSTAASAGMLWQLGLGRLVSKRSGFILSPPPQMLFPVLFAVGCWAMYLYPAAFNSVLPSLPFLAGPAALQRDRTLLSVLGKRLQNLSFYDIWQVAQLAPAVDAPSARATMAAVLNVPADVVTGPGLAQFASAIRVMEAKKDVIASLAGLFTFVNLAWVIAALGVAVSSIPFSMAVYALLKPFIDPIVAWAVVTLLPAVIAALTRLYAFAQPCIEGVIYAACLYIVGAATRYPAAAATNIASTGLMLMLGPAMVYSASLHRTPALGAALASLPRGGGVVEVTLLGTLAAASLVPVALALPSPFVGFFAVTAAYAALGFSVVPYGLCWAVGWRSPGALGRSLAASVILVGLMIVARAVRFNPVWIRPFWLGLSTWGSIAGYLAGLILASKWHAGPAQYALANGLYIAALAIGAAAGSVLQIAPLFNVAVTFLCLYIPEKMIEMSGDHLLFWGAVLLSSVLLWNACKWLQLHPEWVAGLLGVGM